MTLLAEPVHRDIEAAPPIVTTQEYTTPPLAICTEITSAHLIAAHSLLASATNYLAPNQAKIEEVRIGTLEWLGKTYPNLEELTDGDIASRIASLVSHLKSSYNPGLISGFALDTSDALCEVILKLKDENGLSNDSDKPIKSSMEWALPVLSYLPEDSTIRSAFLRGVEHYVSAPGDKHEKNRTPDDIIVEQHLQELSTILHASGMMPENVDFYLCNSPEEIGIPLEVISEMESRGYSNSGYGERAEGKQLFQEAFRGYAQEDRLSDLRFVVVAQTDNSGNKKPVAFFDYFKVGKNLFPECATAAERFSAEKGFREQPGRYIFSKLVADPERGEEVRHLHRFALVNVVRSLSEVNPSGVLIETQAQPATRQMIAKHGKELLPGLEILVDLDIEDYQGKKPAKLLLYIPTPE